MRCTYNCVEEFANLFVYHRNVVSIGQSIDHGMKIKWKENRYLRCHSGLYPPEFCGLLYPGTAEIAARICDNVHGDQAVIGAAFVTGMTRAGHPSRRWKMMVPQPGRRLCDH